MFLKKPMLDKSKIPANLYDQENKSDPIVYCIIKLQSMFWFITEYDAENKEAFGFVEIQAGCGELGYIYIPELEDLRDQYNFEISYVEKPLSELKKQLLEY